MRHTIVIVRSGLISALYVALTYACSGLAYGPIQVRIGEALTVLPLLYPEAIPALVIGCALSNITSPFGLYDIIIGSMATFVASFGTFFCAKCIKNEKHKPWIGGIFPVVINAFLIPLVWYLAGNEQTYLLGVLSVFLTQTVFVYGGGIPLYHLLKKLKSKGIKGF